MTDDLVYNCKSCQFQGKQPWTFPTEEAFNAHYDSLPADHKNKSKEECLAIKPKKNKERKQHQSTPLSSRIGVSKQTKKDEMRTKANELKTKLSLAHPTLKPTNTQTLTTDKNHASTSKETDEDRFSSDDDGLYDEILQADNANKNGQTQNSVNNDSIHDSLECSSPNGNDLEDHIIASNIRAAMMSITGLETNLTFIQIKSLSKKFNYYQPFLQYFMNYPWSTEHFDALLEETLKKKSYFSFLKEKAMDNLGSDAETVNTMIDNVDKIIKRKLKLEEKASKAPNWSATGISSLNNATDKLKQVVSNLLSKEDAELMVQNLDIYKTEIEKGVVRNRQMKNDSFETINKIKNSIRESIASLVNKNRRDSIKCQQKLSLSIAGFDVWMFIKLNHPDQKSSEEDESTEGNHAKQSQSPNKTVVDKPEDLISQLKGMMDQLIGYKDAKKNIPNKPRDRNESQQPRDRNYNNASQRNNFNHRRAPYPARGKEKQFVNDSNDVSRSPWIHCERRRPRSRQLQGSWSTTISQKLNSKDRNLLLKGSMKNIKKRFGDNINTTLVNFIRLPKDRINDFLHKQTDFELIEKEKPLVHNLTGIALNESQIHLLSLGSKFIQRPKSVSVEEIEISLEETLFRSLRKYLFKGISKEQLLPSKTMPVNTNWSTIQRDLKTELIEKIFDIKTNAKQLLDRKETVKHNLTIKEKNELDKLKQQMNNNELMIVEADKNMGLCVITETEYSRRIMAELSKLDTSFEVTTCSDDDINETIKKSLDIRDRIISLISKHLKASKNMKRYIKQYLNKKTDPKLPTIKGMPKLHKQGDRMRIILPFHDNIFTYIHNFIATVLQPLAQRIQTSLISSIELIDQIEPLRFDGDDFVVTADLDSMYNRINLNIATDLIIESMKEYRREFHMFGDNMLTNQSVWRYIISNAFKLCAFTFNDKIIKQTFGVAMGSPAGPLIATIFINTILKKSLPSETRIKYCRMYIDDGFFIIDKTTSETEIIPILNKLIEYKDSQLKWDKDSFQIHRIKELPSNPITFLDTNIKSKQCDDYYRLTFSVHCKSMGTYSYIHKRSYHPEACKRSIAYGEATRRLRLSTFEEDYKETLNDLKAKLMRRGYTWNEIEKQFSKAPFSERESLSKQPLQKFKNARDPKLNSNVLLDERKETTNNVIPFVLRYDPRIISTAKNLKNDLETKLNEFIFKDTQLERIRMILSWRGNPNLMKQLNKNKTQKINNEDRITNIHVNSFKRPNTLDNSDTTSSHKRPKLSNPELD